MKKRIAVAVVHGHAAKWLQTCIYSLKESKNEIPFDIFIPCTWPDHPSIKALTETDLGKGVKIFDCKARKHSHATGLDEVLDMIARNPRYDFMFTTETDCRACRDGWLDWFYKYVTVDQGRGMAGFFWEEGSSHFNINPSATIYRKSMLLKYHREVKKNNSGMFWHPRGNKHDTDGGMDPSIKKVAGVFSETRGIENPNPHQLKAILRGVPQASWFEPGAWLYYRMLGEYGGVHLPCDHIYQSVAGYNTPEGTYYGRKPNPYFIHYWGGTRAWDHLKHPVTDQFVKSCSPHWIRREHAVWERTVPEKYRKIMDEIYEEMGLKGLGIDGDQKIDYK